MIRYTYGSCRLLFENPAKIKMHPSAAINTIEHANTSRNQPTEKIIPSLSAPGYSLKHQEIYGTTRNIPITRQQPLFSNKASSGEAIVASIHYCSYLPGVGAFCQPLGYSLLAGDGALSRPRSSSNASSTMLFLHLSRCSKTSSSSIVIR